MKKFEEFLTEKKWIQKAVDPEHKGYCTPMTKPTCTPHRKALAKRFKKHEFEHNEENINDDNVLTEKKWIQKAIEKPGALHKALHVPEGEKIPAEKLEKAAEKPGKLGKRARLAQTLRKLPHGKKNEHNLKEEEERHNYMFFGNLRTINHAIDDMLKMNEADVDKRISDGHDWVNDHIAEAKNNIEQVYHWLMNRKD